MKKLIKISGPKGSGKTTLANMLCDYWTMSNGKHVCKIISLASPMKEALEVFGIDKNTKEINVPIESVVKYMIRDLDIPNRIQQIKDIVKLIEKEKEISDKPIGRIILQIVGTNLIRYNDEDYFVRKAYDKIKYYDKVYNSDDLLFIIDDVRFPNEALKHLGDKEFIIKINNKHNNTDNHESEKYFDQIEADLTIDFPWTITDFENILSILGMRSSLSPYIVWSKHIGG